MFVRYLYWYCSCYYLAILTFGVCLGFLPTRTIPRSLFHRTTIRQWENENNKPLVFLGLTGLPDLDYNNHDHDHNNNNDNDNHSDSCHNDTVAVAKTKTETSNGAVTSRRKALIVCGVAAATVADATRTLASTFPDMGYNTRHQERVHNTIVANESGIVDGAAAASTHSSNNNNTNPSSMIDNNNINTEAGAEAGAEKNPDDKLLESATLYKVYTTASTRPSTSTSTTTAKGTTTTETNIQHGPSVNKVTKDGLLEDLQSKRAIFLGEHHPEGRDHRLQAALIRSLHGAIHGNGEDGGSVVLPTTTTATTALVVGLEAVQRQFQPVLDRYCAGAIDEEELRAATEWESRWYWSFEAYKPIFRTCLELGVGLLALDIATEDRATVEKGGLAALDTERLLEYVPDPDLFSEFGSTRAYQKFVEYTLKPPYDLQQKTTTTNNSNNTTPPTFSNFVARQMLRDESMASAAMGWLSKNPRGILVGCIGINHATFGCGVPGRVEQKLYNYYYSNEKTKTNANAKTKISNGLVPSSGGKQQMPKMVASVLINPEPLNTGTELKICRAEGRPPVDDDDEEEENSFATTVKAGQRKLFFVPNTRNEVCIENSIEVQNYALQLDYVSSSSSLPSGETSLEGHRAAARIHQTAAKTRQAREGETVLGLSDYLVFSPKETKIVANR